MITGNLSKGRHSYRLGKIRMDHKEITVECKKLEFNSGWQSLENPCNKIKLYARFTATKGAIPVNYISATDCYMAV